MAQPEQRTPDHPHGEDRGLLAGDDEEDLVVHQGRGAGAGGPSDDVLFDQDEMATTPRSGNHVRFDLTPEIMGPKNGSAEGRYSSSDSHRFDYDDEDDAERGGGSLHGDSHHRVPLLTDREAPSVAVANEWDAADDGEDWAHREMHRPKSGLRSAFMNMANSIIGAGIIGQPYAMRQAGLLAGTLLLIGLTVLIDWTICLIVINSKLSGTSSFQGTVQHCFGRPGLIAISLAQWVFAFGGMVAFGVIVGDTIPHVLRAVWPDLPDLPVIGLLADRRIAIVVFCMGISYPLTLYRDIAKVRTTPVFPLPWGLSQQWTRLMLLCAACSWPRRAPWP